MTCNREFNVFASTLRKGHGNYCSRQCRPAWNKGLNENPKTTAKRSEILKIWWSNPKNIEMQSRLHKGQKPWNTGTKGIHLIGEKNPQWKGDNVGYHSLHSWIHRQLGMPDICEECKNFHLSGHKIHWANISGEYKRDINDWIRLCTHCHAEYDTGRRVFQ